MKEMITDELLDELFTRYRFYKSICKEAELKPMTFEEFVELRLGARELQIQKLRKGGFYVR